MSNHGPVHKVFDKKPLIQSLNEWFKVIYEGDIVLIDTPSYLQRIVNEDLEREARSHF
jgi:hypothetical protein